MELLRNGLIKPHKVLPFLHSQHKRKKRKKITHHAVINMVSSTLDTDINEVKNYYNDLTSNNHVLELIRSKQLIGGYALGDNQVLTYLTCRTIQPDIVIETGVYKGKTSTCLLQALEDNGKGNLYSIDLPGTKDDPVVDESAPSGSVRYELSDKSEVGEIVPDHLRDNWDLRFGRSDEMLEDLLEEVGKVDVFYHDSEHSYENMMYEFQTVHGYMSDNNAIISDDINWSDAFYEFSKKHSKSWDCLDNYLDEDLIKAENLVGICKV